MQTYVHKISRFGFEASKRCVFKDVNYLVVVCIEIVCSKLILPATQLSIEYPKKQSSKVLSTFDLSFANNLTTAPARHHTLQ